MTRRILLADDSVTIQKVIELTFMDEDYEVNAVSNGDEAVASLSRSQPDVVIADVHMPGANGYEVCRRSKALRPEVPVLLLVGTFEPFDEAQSRSAGADAFLKKPFDSQELLHLVGQLLAASPTPAEEQPAAFPSGPTAQPSEASSASPLLAGLSPVAEPQDASVEAYPPGPSAAAFPPGPTVGGYPSDSSLGSPSLEDTAEPFAALDSEPTWSNFDLESEPEPAAAEPGAANWEDTPGPIFTAQEQVFVDEGTGGLQLDDSMLDDSLLDDVPPLSEAEAEGLVLDDSYERAGWREDRAAAPTGSGPGLDATPEERSGVPLGAAPLASGLDEVEKAVAEHEGAPAFAAAPATPDSPPWSSPAPAASGAASEAGGSQRLSDEDVERIARRVAELVGDRVVRDVAWEVVPDMAELVIKDRLRELESQVD